MRDRKGEAIWAHANKEIFAIFWSLELQDIAVPETQYDELIEGKKVASKEKSSAERNRQNDENKLLRNLLQSELDNKQKVNYESVKSFLKANLVGYFKEIRSPIGLSNFLVQNCLYPRIMFSPADALYSIEFLKLLIELKVPNMNILQVFAQILIIIVPSIHCCTNNESENLGIFFMEWFKIIQKYTDVKNWSENLFGISHNNFKTKIYEQIHIRFFHNLVECF